MKSQFKTNLYFIGDRQVQIIDELRKAANGCAQDFGCNMQDACIVNRPPFRSGQAGYMMQEQPGDFFVNFIFRGEKSEQAVNQLINVFSKLINKS